MRPTFRNRGHIYFFLYLPLLILTISTFSFGEYRNPVMGAAPDPSVLRFNNKFYLYPTCNGTHMPVYESDNLINWVKRGYVFGNNAPKLFKDGGGLWAPDVIELKGKIIMAYSLSKWGEIINNGIGIAIADNPLGPFRDTGMLFTSKSIGVKNSIDPSFFYNKNKLFLTWGSFHGIYLTELDISNINHITLNSPIKKIKIAGNKFEASHIYKRGNFYYLFASAGSCCAGIKSTYKVVVGRSKKLEGPYVNKEGEFMLNNASTTLIQSNKDFVGPGHGSTIISDKMGKTWYILHSYERNQISKARQVIVVEIKWDKNGWPVVEGNAPSLKAENPVF